VGNGSKRPNGHLNGVLAVGQAADKIRAFLAR
jgi:hypothetical protein